MTDAVEEAPLAQFKSALTLSLQEENLELYQDLISEVAEETGKEPAEIAAAAARLARRAQEADVLERISGYELEKAKPATRATRPVQAGDDSTPYRGQGTGEFTPREFSPRGFSRRGAGRGSFGGDRQEYGARPSHDDRSQGSDDKGGWRPVEQGMTRLFISAGRMDGVRPGDLVGAIAGESGIEGSSIGSIDIFSRYSFVEVQTRDGDRVISALDGAQVRGRSVQARPATPPTADGGGDRPERDGGRDFGGRAPRSSGGYRGGGGGGYRGGGGGGYRGGGGGGGGYRGGGGGGGYRGGGGGGGYRGGGGGGYRGGGGGGGYQGGGGGGRPQGGGDWQRGDD